MDFKLIIDYSGITQLVENIKKVKKSYQFAQSVKHVFYVNTSKRIHQHISNIHQHKDHMPSTFQLNVVTCSRKLAMSKNQIQILIAYDQQLIADGLAAILSLENDFNVIDTVSNKVLNVEIVKQNNPDILFFEFARWPKHYLEFVKQFSDLYQNLKILILSELISHDSLVKIMSFVNGYMLRTCSSEKVLTALHEVFHLGKYLCPQEIKEFFRINKTDENHKLTPREEEVLSAWLVSNGSNKMADSLNISESTVRTHLKNIRQKIGGKNKIDMLIYACQNSILNKGKEPICRNCKYSYSSEYVSSCLGY